jgi:two-component system cell cycle response regulator DivK
MAKILLVDDTPGNRVLGEKLLRVAGHQVVLATTASEAIATASEQQPDLVLLDLGLPDIDGWEALRRMREMPATSRLRIVAFTAHAMTGDRDKAIAAGFDGYMSKPIEMATFAKTVEAHLR